MTTYFLNVYFLTFFYYSSYNIYCIGVITAENNKELKHIKRQNKKEKSVLLEQIKMECPALTKIYFGITKSSHPSQFL